MEALFRACPVCGQNGSRPRLQKGALELVVCTTCGMVYANPVRADLASGQYYDRIGRPFYLSPEKLAGDYAPVRFERELRLLKRFCSGGRMLDVGCSTGAFLYQLNQQEPARWQVQGIDVATAALDYAASRGVAVIRDSFLEHDFKDLHFDAITFWAVMEHLSSPKAFLEKAVEITAEGGYIIILVPNIRSLVVRCVGRRYRYIYEDHVNYFAPDTLKRFISQYDGLRVVEQGSMHFNPIVLAQDFRSTADRVPDEDRARLLKKTTGYKQSTWAKPLRPLYRCLEQILGRFNLADNIYIVAQKRGKQA